MPLIVWTDQMSVGVKLLDNDHKKLVLLINQMHAGLMTGRAKPSLERVFQDLISYTRIHHSHEEQLLLETGFHGTATHKQEHESTIERAVELQMRFKSSEVLGAELEIMHQLREWLFRHIQGSDKEFVAHLKAKGVDAILATRKTLDGVTQSQPANEIRVVQGVW
ncbi:MAG: bacteriohemerythrin [Terracidiphilus sp.]